MARATEPRRVRRGFLCRRWHSEGVEILWWLAPAVVVTVLTMLWVGWLGRAGRGHVDRDVAVERLGKGLRTQHKGLARPTPAATRAPDRSTGVAVRPSRSSAAEQSRRSA